MRATTSRAALYGPKRDGEYAPDAAGTPADQIAELMTDPEAPPIMSRADTVREKYRHPVTYFKAAFGLTLLREDILGPERFDPAFRKYIADWAFKHPKPSDFFREMESAGGEDLSYFWRGYFLNNWTPRHGGDRRVRRATRPRGRIGDGREPGPAGAAGDAAGHLPERREARRPHARWRPGCRPAGTPIAIEGGGPIAEATVDPDHRLPDADRSNNSMKAK